MSEYFCKVSEVSPLTSSIIKVVLTLADKMEFKAGQYIQVVMGEQDKRPFSIASGPSQPNEIELHIGADPSNSYAYDVIQAAKNSGSLTIEGPCGEAYLIEDDSKPSILIAGGTGYSYVRSIVDHCLHIGLTQPLIVYWGTKSIDEMYEFSQLTLLAQQHSNLTFIPVVETAPDNWSGKVGWVHQAVMFDHADLSPFRVYVAGRFEMAKVIREDFVKKGLLPENLLGDAYAFI